mmetsp:Transcript_44327/g.72139  ORF Transcript_44327/g.72139 Transcript_44327/m.72139 type:complete len:202 (-) Transcript_44327:3214-3819(-)
MLHEFFAAFDREMDAQYASVLADDRSSILHLRPGLYNKVFALGVCSFNVLRGAKGALDLEANVVDSTHELVTELVVPTQLFILVLHTYFLSGLHEDTVIETSASIALEVLAIRIRPEDEATTKQGSTLAGEAHDTGSLRIRLFASEAECTAGIVAHKSLTKPNHTFGIQLILIFCEGIGRVDDKCVLSLHHLLYQYSHDHL